MSPVVSVITPCHNDGQFLRKNVESVRQSGRDYEHIIVDDGSTDAETIDLLARISDDRTRVFRKRRSGPAAARNYGISRARGRYILNLDADDLATPAPFIEGARLLDENDSVDVVYGDYENFGAVRRVVHAPEFCPFKMLFANRVGIASLYRRSSWEAVQGFAERDMIFEDWQFWLKILANGGGFRRLNATFFKYFVRSSGKSFSDDRRYRDGFDQIRRSLPMLYTPENLRALASRSGISAHERLYFQHLLPLMKQGYGTPAGKHLLWFVRTYLKR